MSLKRRIKQLETQGAENPGMRSGMVLVVKDVQNLTEAEAQELAAARARVRPGGAVVVVLPDNGRG